MQQAVEHEPDRRPAVTWEYLDGSHPESAKPIATPPRLLLAIGSAMLWLPTAIVYGVSWLGGVTVAVVWLTARWAWATIETGFREGMGGD